MEIFLTIITGLIIFCCSQYFLKLVLEPIIEFKKLLSQISHTLLTNQKKFLSANTNENLHKTIADLSAQLRSFTHIIPFHEKLIMSTIFRLPKKGNILSACRELNKLSYGMIPGVEEKTARCIRNEIVLKKISDLLGIETTFMLDDE